MREIEKEEKNKVKALNPGKYIFITSLWLSRKQKKDIKEKFHPYLKQDDDVFWEEDLSDLLDTNQDIYENNYKLWMNNPSTISKIVNNAIIGRSKFEIERIQKKINKYILTENHERALKILKEKHVLIIYWEPGIGKTTLAENLSLFFTSNGYEFVSIEENISEAENAYNKNKQIFYFDDFLGSNYFEAIENKKDSHIINFIERVKNDPQKRFILTTRTNILNNWKAYSPYIEKARIETNELLLKVENLNLLDKAKILYNHIYFWKLTEEQVSEIYKDKRYKEIIKHKNYNPRIIESITSGYEEKEGFWDYVLDSLNNPKNIWANSLGSQTNEYVRCLVYLTVFNWWEITEKNLQISYEKLIEYEKLWNNSHTEKDFNSMVRLAIKSFLNRSKNSEKIVTYSLFNPSITDYVLNHLNTNTKKLEKIFKALNTAKSLKLLGNLSFNKIVSKDIEKQIKLSLLSDEWLADKNSNYIIYLLSSCSHYEEEWVKTKILMYLRKIFSKPQPIDEIVYFLDLITEYYKELWLTDFNFIVDYLPQRILDESELNGLWFFVEQFSLENDSLNETVRDDILYHVQNDMDYRKNDLDLSEFIDVTRGYGGELEVDYNERSIERKIEKIAEKCLENFEEWAEKLDITTSYVSAGVDIETMMNDYIADWTDSDRENNEDLWRFYKWDEDIDDLFERT